MKPQEIARVSFYELLWEKPISRIAEQFEVRSIDIVKAADHAAIPRPPNGYWTKLSHGIAVSRPPLPNAPEGQTDMVALRQVRKVRASARSEAFKQADGSVQALKSQPPTSTCKRHRFVVLTAKALKAQKAVPPQYIISSLHESSSIDVRVRKENFERTLAFLDALIAGAEARGIEIVEVKGERLTTIALQASGEPVHFRIIEKVNRKEVPKDPDSSRLWKEYTYHPTDRLEFQFDSIYGVQSRWRWGDGVTQRIEGFVEDILEKTVHICAEKRRLALERAEQHRQWEEQAKVRKEKERQAALERTRRERLSHHLQRWMAANQLRSFAEAAQRDLSHESECADFLAWQAWVRSVANESDPFSDKTPPWIEWAEHLRRSSDPEVRNQFWPEPLAWEHISAYGCRF